MDSVPTHIKNEQLVKKRREQLVLAAIRLFAQKGYHKTSLKDLARESGISYGNIYDYIGCKEDIFFLIHSYANESARKNFLQHLRGVEHPLARLRNLIKAELDVLYEWNDAVLLLYRETHVLMNKPDHLARVLQREREHSQVIEGVLRECIAQGCLPEVNVRLASNLIKIMCEVCVLKRWDLKGRTTRSEMESLIVDIIFQGLVVQDGSTLNHEPAGPASPFKSALFLNGDTPLAGAIRTFLLSRGLKLAVYSQAAPEGSAPPHASPGAPDGARRYGPADAGPLSEACLQHILDDFGPVDLVIHDLGTGTVSPPREDGSGGQRLEANLRGALDLAPHLEAKMAEFGRGRILYLAPWAWDVHVDSLWYQSVKTGTASLAKAMARRLSASRVTVNCLIPGFVGGLIPLGARSSAGVPEFGKRLKRDVEISELLKLVGFLLSEDSQCLTGQVLETGGLNG